MARRIPVLTKKIILNIVIAGFILCTLIFATGYLAFSRQFRTQYDESIRSIASAARECLDPDSFDSYLLTGQHGEEYDAINKILQDFVDKFDLNMIYVSFVTGENYTDITYIYNPVKINSRYKSFPLGYFEVYVEPDYNTSAKKVFENGETIVRHTIKTRSGSHITAMVPVYNSSQKIVAVLGAQMNIQAFVRARQSYTNLVIIVELIFAVLFVIFFSSFFNLHFIKPIVSITKETDHFASYGGAPAENLMKIKNHDELAILAHSVYQMECDVNKNIEKLTNVTAEKERMSTELNIATKIQSGMLPKGYPAFPERNDFDLYAVMEPAKEVGGDLYDYLLIDDDHLMIVVGDVSGKGVPAALFMAIAKTLLASHAEQGAKPADIFEAINNQLCRSNEMEMFVTCWLGIITLSSGLLRFVNAGHPCPLLMHKGEFSYLKSKPNLMLAGMDGIKYQEHSFQLEKGDGLIVYTDGVTEAMNSSQELFGDERLLASVKGCEEFKAPDVIKKIRSDIDSFVAGAEQFDDITMLAVKLI
ncbi:MAG: serine/threonine-protein phosphatase [Treponema sp.]|nr:serine/threonine-protein phosphatase [Treponema sp.]